MIWRKIPTIVAQNSRALQAAKGFTDGARPISRMDALSSEARDVHVMELQCTVFYLSLFVEIESIA